MTQHLGRSGPHRRDFSYKWPPSWCTWQSYPYRHPLRGCSPSWASTCKGWRAIDSSMRTECLWLREKLLQGETQPSLPSAVRAAVGCSYPPLIASSRWEIGLTLLLQASWDVMGHSRSTSSSEATAEGLVKEFGCTQRDRVLFLDRKRLLHDTHIVKAGLMDRVWHVLSHSSLPFELRVSVSDVLMDAIFDG